MQLEQDIPPSCRLRVFLHGPLELWKREASGAWKLVEKDAWGKGRAARSVFKRLLVSPGRRLSRSAIQDDIWPDVENFELADKNTYNAINQIRRVIGSTLVRTIEATYEIADQSLVWTDSDACEALLKEAENRGYTSIQALPLLERALGYLERGELLEGESGAWVYGLRKKNEDLLSQCRLWLAESYEAQDKPFQAALQYRALLQTVPPNEYALQRWMIMLYRQGKIQEAVKCFRDVKGFVEGQGFTLSLAVEQFAAKLEEQSLQGPALHLPSGREYANTRHSLTLPIWANIDILSSTPITTIMPSEQLSALEEPLHISKETLHLFSTLTESCRHLSEGNELRIAEQALWAYLPKIELFIRLSSEHQKMAANIASQGYLLAASLVGHHNDLLRRLRYSKQALYYGKLAGDLNLQVVAMRQIAISFDCMDRPDMVLEVSQQTLPYLKNVSSLLQACIYAGISGAYAELGQEQDARRFIELAYEHFPEQPESEPSYLHTICRYSTLIFFDGLNQLDLGQPHEAEKILARIDGLQPKMQLPERVRIELLNYQIKVFLALKKKEQASAYLEEAANASFSIGSERHFQESFALYRQMQKIWKHEPQVEQLADLFVR
jgi:DNA-binding SARP family transcriptional activator